MRRLGTVQMIIQTRHLFALFFTLLLSVSVVVGIGSRPPVGSTFRSAGAGTGNGRALRPPQTRSTTSTTSTTTSAPASDVAPAPAPYEYTTPEATKTLGKTPSTSLPFLSPLKLTKDKYEVISETGGSSGLLGFGFGFGPTQLEMDTDRDEDVFPLISQIQKPKPNPNPNPIQNQKIVDTSDSDSDPESEPDSDSDSEMSRSVDDRVPTLASSAIGSHEDVQDILEHFINSRPDLSNNLDVITQAFRFVKLDAHLSALVNHLSRLQESHETLQMVAIKQETKLDFLLEEMKLLANSLSSESTKLKEVEGRIETEITAMNQRIDSAIEKIIKSSTTSHILMDLSKESLQQMDKVEMATNQVLNELKTVQRELGDVGQVSVQTVFNVQKSEENMMTALVEMGNRTIYAMRQELSSRVARPGLGPGLSVLLGNGSGGNSMQADAETNTISSTSSSAPSSSSSSSNKLTQCPMSCSSRKRLINGRPMDCFDIQLSGYGNSRSGVYQIFPQPDVNQGIEVYCDLESNGGGWTVIQRRGDQQIPRENFFRAWNDYETGFGSPYNHVWLGLSALAELTSSGDQELRVELTDWDGNFRNANYGYFRIANGTDLYRLHVADYTGTAGDSMAYHNGMPFTSRDQDNDMERNINCAEKYHGAWWYKNCHQSNLNGLYLESKGKQDSYATGINWYSWHGYYYSLKKTEMKIRRRNRRSTGR